MRYTRAIVRRPGPNLVDGLTSSGLGRVDVERAYAQHAAYCAALRALGLAVIELEPLPAHPDSTFVEDTAILTAHGALLTRPGHPSREGEVDEIAPVVLRYYAQATVIEPPGALDGGDVCQLGEHFLIGLSHRTNEDGARQLADWLAARDFTSATIDIRGLPGLLHLKTGLSWLGDGRVSVVEALADHAALREYRRVVVAPDEAYAASCLRFGDTVVMVAGNPRFEAAIRALGARTVALEMSEFRKVDGGLSCLSLRF
jgi:dimethylargininase